jgi:hypothetical protein
MRPLPHRAAARLYVPSACATPDLQIELLRSFSLREYCFLHDFFSNFRTFLFSSWRDRARKYPAALVRKRTGRNQLLQPRPRRIPKKKGLVAIPILHPHPSAHSLISRKMWRRGARSVGMAGGMGRSLPARSALLQSNTATTLTSTSVPPLYPSNRHSCTLIFFVYLFVELSSNRNRNKYVINR